MRGKIIVLMGVKGSGRRTLVDYVLGRQVNNSALIGTLCQPPSLTTRPMRKGEINGNTFHFVSKEEYEKKIKDNLLFAEGKLKLGHRVAAPRHAYKNQLYQGWFPIKDLDLDGARKFKEEFPGDVIVIYIKVTDGRSLFNRVRETEEIVGNQYINLEEEDQAMEAFADHIIENPDGYLEMAKAELWSKVLDIVNADSTAGFIKG